MTRRAAIAAALLLAAAWSAPAGAAAAEGCECSSFDAAAAFETADAVFLGRVERLHEARDDGSGDEVAILEVSDVFKGSAVRDQGVANAVDAECGAGFVPGETYVVYARAAGESSAPLEDGMLRAGPCATARPATELGDLGLPAPYPPDDGGPPSAIAIQNQLGDPRSSLFPEMFILGGVLAFVLGLAAWFSRKNRPAI